MNIKYKNYRITEEIRDISKGEILQQVKIALLALQNMSIKSFAQRDLGSLAVV